MKLLPLNIFLNSFNNVININLTHFHLLKENIYGGNKRRHYLFRYALFIVGYYLREICSRSFEYSSTK